MPLDGSFSPAKLVRVSVANLAHRIVDDTTGEMTYFGIMPGIRIQAVGAVVELTDFGIRVVENAFEATLEKNKETHRAEARFIVESYFLESVLEFFEQDTGERDVERDPTHGIRRRFLVDLRGMGAPLLPEHVATLEFMPRKVVRQPLPQFGIGTSSRARTDMPTRRVFRIYDIVAPGEVIRHLFAHPFVRKLTSRDLSATQGGACPGVVDTRSPCVGGKARQGLVHGCTLLADNLFLP